jgi:GDP-4-dehydro-6-deoxy-D-mannose reductase
VKIFITGATGFVGRHLINLLKFPEYKIYGTSFPEKPGPDDKKKNIVYLDIRSEEEISEAIKKAQPDWVFHLAAVTNVRISWEKRKETVDTNLMGTFYVIEAVRKFVPQARVLFVSSSDVYGTLLVIKKALREEDTFHVTSPYAFTKVTGEILSKFYAQFEGMNIIIARSFPHTGPGQSPDFVCSDWACQIAKIEKGLAEPVIKVGDIRVERDFLDVRDVVKGYLLLMKKGKKGEVYNVCSGKLISLKEILDILLSFSSEKIKVKVEPQKKRKIDIPCLLGDSRKIEKETSWKPEIPIEKTLLDLLEYWRRRV